jgi:hypothetical protein
MLTKNEITSLSLSPTKKDFVQIWNELLDVAGKLSERWDPTSTNESDPGIVILKALTGIADKLNYNIDKNTLEAFMPTAAQEDSMRKLCEMLGYNIKYYQSAETDVTIKYHSSEPSDDEYKVMYEGDGVLISRFTVITNSDKDISYFTTNTVDRYISAKSPVVTLPCMEGQIVKCESINDNNVITINQITENNRFYLPEVYIAENGIFINNIYNAEAMGGTGLVDGAGWEKVDNLNTQPRNSRIFKFGFDSYEGRPYVEFPEDYSELFGDGIFIYYARTNGINGNISPKTLTQLEPPTSGDWSKVAAESFNVENAFAATTGANPETIKQAYNNFKKTIGTFDTLVTCRDYMNKIYQMVDNGKPLVSNILVTDIRNDINRAVTICSCDDAGIFYKETPIVTGSVISETTEYGIPKIEGESEFSELEFVNDSWTGPVPDPDTPPTISEPKFYSETRIGPVLDPDTPITKSDPVPYGDPIESELVPYGDPEFSEYTQDGDPVEKTISVVSEANKPFYSETPATVTLGDITRTTNWFIPAGGGGRIALYADEYSREWISSKAFGIYFDCTKPGDVSEYEADGKTISTVWQITQYIDDDSTFRFKTNLPITLVEATNTTIRETRTKTVNNVKTKTINNLQTETVTYLNTHTINNIQTETVTNLKTRTVNNKQIETITKVQENTVTQVATEEKAIDHFDLVLYPFKSYNQIRSGVKDIRAAYDASFDFADTNYEIITGNIEDERIKTYAHNFIKPRGEKSENGPKDIVSINNYMRLSATIATNSKITKEEGSIIVDKIKIALANAFNMRELDFGEAIPFDSILEVIENADSRIRIVSLNEPALYTTFTRLEGYIDGVPDLKEYAVASDWLTVDMAETTGRFELNNVVRDDNERIISYTSECFNSDVAKKIYNKLAVRNVLAGRVPLFKYDSSYGTDFTEAPYLTTKTENVSKPDSLPVPTEEMPYTIWFDTDTGKTYTGSYVSESESPEYKEISLPGVEEAFPAEQGVVKPANGDKIIALSTECIISAHEDNVVSGVTLDEGEFIRFRAPNFITTKTYPAYVNYNLQLNKELVAEPVPAKAVSLFSILNADRDTWSETNTNIRWQKVLNYFDGQGVKQTFSLSQKISAATDTSKPEQGSIVVKLDNTPVSETSESAESLLYKSGCIKLLSKTATITWTPENGEQPPTGAVPIDISLDIDNLFITNTNVLGTLKTAVSNALEEYRDSLPTNCSWTVSFNFECVPFEAASLTKWQDFIRNCANSLSSGQSDNYQVLDFVPVDENNTILWRLYGEGYELGKYITEDTAKLLKFSSSYFGLLPDYYLTGIYLAKDLGQDIKPPVIANNMEYMLKDGEYLYIEYTPSATSEDGTTQELEAITEILGKGTIIKPSGFESGLIDSDILAQLGTTPHKTVTFADKSGTKPIKMQSLGANEQIEIREFAQVTINSEFFDSNTGNKAIYVYKNFANEAFETGIAERKYSLKDGEYIFYTDYDKAEFAYYGSGTEVTLTGNTKIPKAEEVDISTIFESGVQAVPWSLLHLGNNDSIKFQEYQYITLGPKDTLKSLELQGSAKCVDNTWKPCDVVKYVLSGEEAEQELPAIDVAPNTIGNGWEVSSVLELSVDSVSAQVLRNTSTTEDEKGIHSGVKTILTMTKQSGIGGDDGDDTTLKLEPAENSTLSFKTNLACQDSGSTINIDNVTNNPDKLTSFELKVFAADEPAIVKTEPGRVVPYRFDNVTDINKWSGTPIIAKASNELWTQILLEDIMESSKTDLFDRALRLPINLLPNTYGIFSIYVHYTSTTENGEKPPQTWIETIPGTKDTDITLLNVAPTERSKYWSVGNRFKNVGDRLYLRPGVNCIRVNKSGRLFIKTSYAKESQGTLSFDELRLVKYDTVDGQNTTGLNLSQLGYFKTDFKTAKPEDKKISDDTRIVLQETYANSTLNSIKDIEQDAEKNSSSIKETLLEKLPELVNTEKAIKDELTLLCTTYGGEAKSKLSQLFESYYQVRDALEEETKLLEALNANSSVEEAERELADLIESLAAIEAAQQQLTDTLNSLKESTVVSAKNVSKRKILTDFERAVEKGQVELTRFITAYKKALENRLGTQLADLTANLNGVVNSEDRNKLLAAIENMQALYGRSNADTLETQVSRLVSALDRSEIEDTLNSAYSAALAANFELVSSNLAQLRSLLVAKDFQTLVDKIEKATEEENNLYLNQLVNELETLINAASSAPAALISTIDEMTEHVQGLVKAAAADPDNDPQPDPEVLVFLTDCREVIFDYYDTKLTTILSEIKGTLAAMNIEAYNAAIINLQANQNGQVQVYLEELNNIISEFNKDCEAITEITDLKKVEYLDLPLSLSFIVDFWGKSLETKATNTVGELCIFIGDAIYDTDSAAEYTIDNLNNEIPEEFNGSQVFEQLIDYPAFKVLFTDTVELARKATQNMAGRSFIEGIEDLTSLSLSIQDAMQPLDENKPNRRSVITGLISRLRGSLTLTEKQQVIDKLKAELTQSIENNAKLQKSIAKLLCPSLLSSNVSEDSFYSKLKSYIKANAAELENNKQSVYDVVDMLANSWKNNYDQDNDLLDCLKSTSTDKLNGWLANLDNSADQAFRNNTLLPEDIVGNTKEDAEYVDGKLRQLRDFSIIAEDTKLIKEIDLFKLTLNELCEELDVVSETDEDGKIYYNSREIKTQLIKDLLSYFLRELKDLEKNTVSDEFKKIFDTVSLEQQLLSEIRELDVNNDFYYNVPVELSRAIEFNEDDPTKNTLLNPVTNFDINNVNNTFVISKLDIDYLDKGMQLARSSRLN